MAERDELGRDGEREPDRLRLRPAPHGEDGPRVQGQQRDHEDPPGPDVLAVGLQSGSAPNPSAHSSIRFNWSAVVRLLRTPGKARG